MIQNPAIQGGGGGTAGAVEVTVIGFSVPKEYFVHYFDKEGVSQNIFVGGRGERHTFTIQKGGLVVVCLDSGGSVFESQAKNMEVTGESFQKAIFYGNAGTPSENGNCMLVLCNSNVTISG